MQTENQKTLPLKDKPENSPLLKDAEAKTSKTKMKLSKQLIFSILI